RVINEDRIDPGTRFGRHGHRDMEIVSYVLEGALTHADSMGNRTVIGAGDVQRMSAGTGLTHSEFNLAKGPVHFHQIWLYPDRRDLTPTYDQRHFEPEAWRDRLLPVASGQGLSGAVSFHTDATIYRCDLSAGRTLDVPAAENRRLFLYLIAGRLDANGSPLTAGDQARIDLEPALALRAAGDSAFVLIDVPSCRGWGYDRKTLSGARA
ncbi:MAG TPA: pirin family protein, partial [Acidobacteriota bacterium]|nr:pirin family protein [Acidobacteriota bacterium]